MLFVLIVFLFSIVCVSASDVNDTLAGADEIQVLEANENSEDILTSADNGTFTSLQKKINEAPSGSTITLDRDYSYDENFRENGIIIDKDLTINGNGHKLDGKSKSRIFLLLYGLRENNKITLNNINFVNGHTNHYGGAILNFANLKVNKCTFTNNRAYHCGGAINSVGYLDCRNSNFNKNVAGGDGGAVFSLSFENSVLFYHSLFVNKTIDENLEFIITLSITPSIKFLKDRVSHCTFRNNVAKGRGGGGVYAFSAVNVASSTFISNVAGEKGGAVFANMNLYVQNSKFTGNRAPMYGGAIYFKCHGSTGHYDERGKWVSGVKFFGNSIQKSVFTKNVASKGGAIYGFRASDSDRIHCAKAVRCTFAANKASVAGRDIYGGTASKCVFNYLKLTLKTVTVKKSAKKVVLSARLFKGKTLFKGKVITFKFNGKILRAKTNSYGIAKATVTKGLLNKLTVGKNVQYMAGYGKLSVKKTVKVRA